MKISSIHFAAHSGGGLIFMRTFYGLLELHLLPIDDKTGRFDEARGDLPRWGYVRFAYVCSDSDSPTLVKPFSYVSHPIDINLSGE